jgi:CelD/BcsL family acetyltransferase involved in cellulose biosynthesis
MAARDLTLEVGDRIEPLAEAWDELADRAGAPPFVRPGWIDAWRRSFGRGALRIFIVKRRDRLVGLAPLERRAGRLRSPTNEHTPEFDVLALDDEAQRALVESLFADGARTVILRGMDARSRSSEAVHGGAGAAGYRAVVRPLGRAPYIRGGRSLADHERSLSRNLRHDVERRLRRLCEAGSVSVQLADGREGLDELLDEGFGVERAGWKGGERTAIASDPRTRRFYADVAHWAASRGWLRLAFLRLDRRAIAFQFDLQVDRTYYSLKIGYDAEYERFSPGKLLAYTMISRAVVAGLSSYELLGTDEPWKHRWTQDARERVALHAFAPSPAGLLSWSAHVHGRPLARRIPLAPRIAAALRR